MYRGLLRTTARTRVHHLFIRTDTGRTHPNSIDRLHEHTKDHVRAALHGRLGMEPQASDPGGRAQVGPKYEHIERFRDHLTDGK